MMNLQPNAGKDPGEVSERPLAGQVRFKILVLSVILALTAGGVVGFFVGVQFERGGKEVLKGLTASESPAGVASPQELTRERFHLQYPSNWKIDTDGEGYDPDHLFSIESPGTWFVMFIIAGSEIKPEESAQAQIAAMKKVLGRAAETPIEKYGRFSGKGAILRGNIPIAGRMTAKVFAFTQDDLTVTVVQQGPDEDMKNVQAGLNLIENSFVLTSGEGRK